MRIEDENVKMNFILTPCICVSHVTVTVTWFDLFVLDMKTETACEGKTLDLRKFHDKMVYKTIALDSK
jgi:hypothetical protein